MAILASRALTGRNGGVPWTVLVVDGASDLPAVARCGLGDLAFGVTGDGDGKSWQVQKSSGGVAWVEITPGSGGGFTPPNDNLTDLGDSTHRFRTLWLGTSIVNTSGDLTVDLRDPGITRLRIENSTGPDADLSVEGDVSLGGTLLPAVTVTQDLGSASARWRDLYLSQSIVAAGAGGLFINCSNGADTVLQVGNSGAGVCQLEVDGYVKAGVAARLSGPPGFVALLNGGQGAGLQVTDTPGSVNGVNVATATTGSGVALSAYGTDSEVGLTVAPKGGGVASTLTLGLANQKVLVGGASGSRVGFYGSTTRVQGSAVTAPVGGVTVDTECRAAVNALIARLNVSTGVGLILG